MSARTGSICPSEAARALGVADGGALNPARAGEVLDRDEPRWVVSESAGTWIDPIHQTSLVMAIVPAVAIVVAMVPLRPRRTVGSNRT